MLGNHDLPERAIAALAEGRKIEAIRALREATGLGLKDAKDAVEQHLRDDAALRARYESARPAAGGAAIRWILVIVVAAAVYLYFRSR